MWLRFVALLALWTSVAHISAVAGALEPALTPGSTGSDISVLTRETSLTTGKNSSILSPRSAISNHCTREHRALLHRRLTTLHIWCAEAIRTLTNTAANGPNHEAEFGRGGESLSPLSPAEISRLFRGTFLRDSERGRSYALEHYRSLEREAEWLSSDNPFRSVRSRLTIECDEGPAARRECGPEDKTMVRHAFGWQRGVILVCDGFWELPSVPPPGSEHGSNQVGRLLASMFTALLSDRLHGIFVFNHGYRYARYASLVYFRTLPLVEN